MNLKSWLLAAVAAVAFANPASAALVVNTGTPTGNPNWSLGNFQYFGAEFTLANASVIHGIDGYFQNMNSTGKMDFAIHADGGNTPGAVLFTTSVNYGATTLDWHGVSGLDWALAGGTYWVSFHVDNNFSGVMPGSAANPLGEYALGNGNYAWSNGGANVYDFLAIGVRVDATDAATVPEPASFALVGLSLAILAAARRKQRAR